VTFSSVPQESKSKIKKAGEILKTCSPDHPDYKWALDLADKWRACHAYPINTFQSTLRLKLKKYSKNTIVAQRLKRMPTIIDKLKRFHPNMQLTTMQDIGGIRAVLGSINEVYTLADEYRKSSLFAHKLINEHDYIQNPRDEDGYRSLHLIYQYVNKKNPDYDGLKLELQIRTKLQHTWATAVETMNISRAST
jgi:putative GTP pyrophosphokinase